MLRTIFWKLIFMPVLCLIGLDSGRGISLPQMNGPWPEIFCAMQRILDPSGCMAPSRYEPLWRKDLPVDFINNPKEAELCIR